MKNIRRGVFETNSSSSHSITISDKNCTLDTLPVEGGVVKITDGEFGWEVDNYRDAYSKASYAYTWAKRCSSDDEFLTMLIVVVKKHTGATSVEFEDCDGYIDHQSCDICEEAFAGEDTLKNFIFNPNTTTGTAR
jgi:hypothetical protein